MKKIFCSLILSSILFFSLAAEESLISFNAGLSSGIPFYDENSVPLEIDNINTNYRAIVGTFANINYNVIQQITFFTGVDLLTDLNWGENLYKHHLHIGFPLGFKVYPGLGGLDLGLAYTLGLRSDFIKNEDGNESNVASWGNGFKLLVEYNFAHEGNSKYLPTIGCSWNLMPRGNHSYDNLITFYLAENF